MLCSIAVELRTLATACYLLRPRPKVRSRPDESSSDKVKIQEWSRGFACRATRAPREGMVVRDDPWSQVNRGFLLLARRSPDDQAMTR